MLLDPNILQLPTKDRKVEAVSAAILAAVEDGSFTYTDLMFSDTGLYTLAFEIMDGIKTDSVNVPKTGQSEVLDVGPVRLVSIDPERTIRYPELKRERIPGTNIFGKPVKRVVEYGLDAMINDSNDKGRIARRLLLQHGWPILNVKSRMGLTGYIVEWKWFEKAATGPDATPEYRDLYDAIKNRPAPQAQKIKRTNAPQPGAGV